MVPRSPSLAVGSVRNREYPEIEPSAFKVLSGTVMISIGSREVIALRSSAFGAVFAAAVALSSSAGFAQQADELSKLVLEPMPLSGAQDVPLDQPSVSAAERRRL